MRRARRLTARGGRAQWKALVGGDTHHPKTKETFRLNIAGATFDIGYDDWYLTLSNQVRARSLSLTLSLPLLSL